MHWDKDQVKKVVLDIVFFMIVIATFSIPKEIRLSSLIQKENLQERKLGLHIVIKVLREK